MDEVNRSVKEILEELLAKNNPRLTPQGTIKVLDANGVHEEPEAFKDLQEFNTSDLEELAMVLGFDELLKNPVEVQQWN